MTTPARVLLVEDDPLMRRILRRHLVRSQPPMAVADAPDLQTARAIVARFDVDCVVLDLHLPDGSGAAFAAELLQQPDHPALVVLTGQGDARVARSLLKAGADDFLDKSSTQPQALCWAVRHAVDRARRRTGRQPPEVLPAMVPEPGVRARISRRNLVHTDSGRTVGWELHASLGSDPLYPHLMRARSDGSLLELELRLLRARLTAVRMLPRGGWVLLPLLASTLTHPAALRLLLEAAQRSRLHKLVAMGWQLDDHVAGLETVRTALRSGGVGVGVGRLGRGPRALDMVLALRPSWVRLDSQLLDRSHADNGARATVAQLAHLGRALGANVVAPGTRGTAALATTRLRAMGVDHAVLPPDPTAPAPLRVAERC